MGLVFKIWIFYQVWHFSVGLRVRIRPDPDLLQDPDPKVFHWIRIPDPDPSLAI